MIYSFNRGVGWASSGVEYAQAYRAKLFRKLGVPARFVYTDMFRMENIQHLTSNLGLLDQEVIWIYSYFTDFPIEATSYQRKELEASFGQRGFTLKRKGGSLRYFFPGEGSLYVNAILKQGEEEIVQRAEYCVGGKLVRKDFFTSGRLFSEYYAQKEGEAAVCMRRFFNRDGSEALVEIVDGEKSIFRVGGELLDSKERFVAYFVERLELKEGDVVMMDRATDIAHALFRKHGRAKIGSVVHAEHYSPKSPNPDHLLWNNFYEYEFTNAGRMDFFICSTKVQSDLLRQQLSRLGRHPKIYTIPVGSIEKRRPPCPKVRPHSLLTCSRLAPEKHVDWLVRAVALARGEVGDLTLDIYGQGAEKERIQAAIHEAGAQEYITFQGHQNLEGVYEKYAAYVTATTSEGFGLTLMEAVGSSLPIIGFDAHYGTQTFILDGVNGYKIPLGEEGEAAQLTEELSRAIVRLFQEADFFAFQKASYLLAESFTQERVLKAWQGFLEEMSL